MAYILREGQLVLPKVAASAIGALRPVQENPAVNDEVLPTASNGARVLGLSIATAATAQDPIAVQTEGVAKAVANASLGAGTLVSCTATTGGQLGIAASGAQIVGVAQENAAAGQVFAVLLKPSVNVGAN